MTPDEFRRNSTCLGAFRNNGLRCEPVDGYRGDVAFALDDIAEVILCVNVAQDYDDDLRAVVRLADGRFAYMLNSCCSCGFDVAGSEGQAWVTDDYDALVQFGIGAEGLARLPDLPRDISALRAAKGGAT